MSYGGGHVRRRTYTRGLYHVGNNMRICAIRTSTAAMPLLLKFDHIITTSSIILF